jgi:hypothetical protein
MTGRRQYRRGFGTFAQGILAVALALSCGAASAELVYRQLAQPGEMQVTFTGPITPADVASAGLMARRLESGQLKLSGNAVGFASLGGDMNAGMELGRLLRRLGVVTVVGKNDKCLSSCVFAFMGGERRIVHGRLGIHRPYFPTTQADPERLNRFRDMQRSLREYIDELDFPGSFYEAVMAVPPESMKMLAAEDLKRFYLQGISPSSEDIADAAAARSLGISMLDYLRRKASLARGVADDPGRGPTPQAAPGSPAVGSGDSRSSAP